MLRAATLTICLALGLTGCARLADSRINPLNWFGRSASVAATPETRGPLVPSGGVVVVDNRALIETVTDLRIERKPGGAIVRATGIAATQGYFNAQLVLTGIEGGVARYDFRVEAPAGYEAVGSVGSRRITAAVTLGSSELAGIRSIEVRGATNAQRSSR